MSKAEYVMLIIQIVDEKLFKERYVKYNISKLEAQKQMSGTELWPLYQRSYVSDINRIKHKYLQISEGK